MNENMLSDQWKSLAPNIRQHWNKLTEQDLQVSAGSESYLIDKVEKRYGISHSEAEKQVREFEQQMSKHSKSKH
ncbi:CsbD family protein [Dyella acidiphila]|uniref:CsbD family protein n=1 Tax=Dyella acidiphila TaxID=2775866 RepID=A0ABR9G5Y6_9GAMM|nr:CsbD family protein [Dyella acidiphila]MBE1159457.1 CsbD family protein [Dyella acidiphila]